MKFTLLFSISIQILLSVINAQPTLKYPTLAPNHHISPIQCEKADGSMVEVDSTNAFTCKLSYMAIRPGTIMPTMHRAHTDPLHHEAEECQLWVLQFSDSGLVQQSCCGAGVVTRLAGKKEDHAAKVPPVQNPPPVQDHVNAQEPVATEEIHQPVQRMVQADHVASEHGVDHEHEDHDEHDDHDEHEYHEEDHDLDHEYDDLLDHEHHE